jgi:hypothetical protein
LPAGAAPPHGFRCGGSGSDRLCEDRTRNGSAFVCGTQRCLQERPRMPDDGEWECVEMSGVVCCHGRGLVAGRAAGPTDLGWQCGPRRGAPQAPPRSAGAMPRTDGERICVDLDPDRPPLATHRRCRFEPRMGMVQRSCTQTKALVAGDACKAADECPKGTRCEAGLCLPARPVPACWLDRDCETGSSCVLGSCAKAGA